MPITPQPNFPSQDANTALGGLQPQSDAEESAMSYFEASIAMLQNAAESFPPLQDAVRQIATFMKIQLQQVLGGQGQGPQGPPQEPPTPAMGQQAGPALPSF
jgi:hypothetical protein